MVLDSGALSKQEPIGVELGDGPNLDAFARLRVSNPTTIFDSKNVFDDPDLAANVENKPLFYDNQETAGGGTATAYDHNEASQSLSVSLNTAGTRVRQTRMRFNYQPGKSQMVLITFNLKGGNAGNTKRVGIFDDDNGLFLELDGETVNFVRRTSTSGAAVDNEVAQSAWNLDKMDGSGKSMVTLDFTKTQILFIDYEWLGVGRVRMGFVIDGMPIYAHEFLNTNNLDIVYMQTPNLPLREEIINDGTGIADSLEAICASVISEGGSQELGVLRYASTAGTHVDANVENTIYGVLGIRLKSAYLDATIKIINAALQIHTASEKCEWMLIFNPTVAGAPVWNNAPQSAIQYAKGALAHTITNGYIMTGGYVESGGTPAGASGGEGAAIENAILLGSLIDGTPDEIWLCIMPIGGSADVDVEGGLTWRELT